MNIKAKRLSLFSQIFSATEENSGVQVLPLFIVLGLGLCLWFCPVPQNLNPQAWRLFSIFVATIVGLIIKPLPVSAVCLIAMTIAITTGVAQLNTVFQAYASPSIWLIVFAFFFARGLINTGLAKRAAYVFISLFGKTTLGLSFGIIFCDLLLAPFIPSLAARSGGIVFPILSGILKGAGDENADTATIAKQRGTFLMLTTCQAGAVISSMFLTAMASNPLVAQFSGDLGVPISWATWALAASVPGLLCICIIPFVIYKLVPPTIKHFPEAPKIAKEKLEEMGPMKGLEWVMLFTFACVLVLWIIGTKIGIDSVTAAMLGLSVMLVTGILSWNDCNQDKGAWNTLFWLGALVGIGSELKNLGFFTWVGSSAASFTEHFDPTFGFIILVCGYFYIHYLIASNTVHITSMFTPFLISAIAIGTNPMHAALTLAFCSTLYGSLTHYGNTPAPIYYSSGYIPLKTWWKVGFIVSLINLTIYFTVAPLWWRILGFI